MNTQEPLGSAAEEAARLVTAARQWWSGHTMAGGSEPGSRDCESTSGAAAGAGDQAQTQEPHACRSCPWCRARTMLAEVSPEVVEHLTAAATSLAAAARELTRPGPGQAGPPDEGRNPADQAWTHPYEEQPR